jgi:hypothetical protein
MGVAVLVIAGVVFGVIRGGDSPDDLAPWVLLGVLLGTLVDSAANVAVVLICC